MTIHATAKPLRTQGEEHVSSLYDVIQGLRRLIAERDAKIEKLEREAAELKRENIELKWRRNEP